MKDYYGILGVPFGASPGQIKRAYRLLVQMSHPDAFPNDPQAQAWANERMKDVNEAYQVLSDPAKRTGYDQKYTAWKEREGREREQQQKARIGCPPCEGRGRALCLVRDGRGDSTCSGCHGQRIVACPVCSGAGSLTQTEYARLVEEMERAERQRQDAEARRRVDEVCSAVRPLGEPYPSPPDAQAAA